MAFLNRECRIRGIVFSIFFYYLFSGTGAAEKILVYTEKNGIVEIDKADSRTLDTNEKKSVDPVTRNKSGTRTKALVTPSLAQLYKNRGRDPAEVYFKSGLEYYSRNDSRNALKNFKFAFEKGRRPLYLFFTALAYKQLHLPDSMMNVLNEIISHYGESDVADDALFERACFLEARNDYFNATKLYERLAEQYPFGLSYDEGEEYLETARKRIRLMRGEMISALKLLNIEGETVSDAYKEFQKKHALPVTGEGDSLTVRAIKAEYGIFKQKFENRARVTARMNDRLRWLLFIGIVLLVNVITAVLIRIKIQETVCRLRTSYEMISEMENANDSKTHNG